MPIIEKTGQFASITEDWLARMLFTDRREAILHFCRYLNEAPRKQILYYHSEGGNGKSLLLLHLREHYCKTLEPDNWQYVLSEFEGEEQLAQLKQAVATRPVPFSFIDFGDRPSGDDRPQEEWSALLRMRRDLSGKGLVFPSYDYACLRYLLKGLKRDKTDAIKAFPADEAGFIGNLADAIEEKIKASLILSALGVAYKKKEKDVSLFLAKRKLTAEKVEHLTQLDPERELYRELPRLFAEDLNAAMKLTGAPKRVALFFDTHESFWGVNERKFTGLRFYERDEWLRLLLGSLSLESGIVAVVAGRRHPINVLRWPTATKYSIPAHFVDAFWVGHLTIADAELFIDRAHEFIPEFKGYPISAEMRRHLIAYSSVRENEVHPFHLGLCVDIVRAAARQQQQLTSANFPLSDLYEQKNRHLVDKLRSWVDADAVIAIDALSACRNFDDEIFNHLGESLRFESTAAAFHRLTEFSFVWQMKTHDGVQYRIHDLMRRLLRDLKNPDTARADKILEAYYHARHEAGHTFSITEAIYHRVQLEPAAGIEEWELNFDKALQQGRYDLCRAFLEVRNHILPPSSFELGQVSRLEGDYYASLSQYEEAKLEYGESIVAYDEALRGDPNLVIAYHNKGLALMGLGDLQAGLAQYVPAQQSYAAAITAYEEALRRAPDLVIAHNNKGRALANLGDLQAGLAQHDDAEQSYAAAITAYEKTLRYTLNYVAAHNNQGLVLTSLGDLQAALSKHNDAKRNYEAALSAYDEALRHSPDDIGAHSNKGNTLRRLGELQVGLAQYESAQQSYIDAVKSFDEALRRASDLVAAHNNKGNALRTLGDLQAGLSKHDDAAQSYEAALAAYDESLRHAPYDVGARNNRGNALISLGKLQMGLAQREDAQQSYRDAVTAFEKVLSLAPNFVGAHNNMGIARASLGKLQAEQAKHDEAEQNYKAALAAYEKALRNAPNDVEAHNNVGNALRNLGDLQTALSRDEQAEQNYKDAVKAFDEALSRAPDYVFVHNNKGLALTGLGDLLAGMARFDDAEQSHKAALTAFDRALHFASDQVVVHNNRGNVLASLGKLQIKQANLDDAEKSFNAALAAYDQVLQRAPDYVFAHNNKGLALQTLGDLQARLAQYEAARQSYQSAQDCFSRSLEIAPAQDNVWQWKKTLEQKLENK